LRAYRGDGVEIFYWGSGSMAAPANGKSGSVSSIIQQIESGACKLGLALPSNLTIEEWTKIGKAIGISRNAMQWAVADWWAAAHAYGARKAADRAGLLGEMSWSALTRAGMVGRHVARKVRRADLSFSHHLCVTGLVEGDQIAWLERAAREKLTSVELRAAIGEWEAQRGGKFIKPRANGQGANGKAKPTHGEQIDRYLRALRLVTRRYGVGELNTDDPTCWKIAIKPEVVIPVQLSLVALEPEAATAA
jgi:hypothetical protein